MKVTVNELLKLEGFSPVVITDGEAEVKGVYIGDLLSWVMGRACEGDAWITIMSNINILAVATLSDVACIILAEGVELSEDIKTAAKDKGINIICSEKSAYDIAVALSKAL
ncbi:MAG: hypothetical protein IJD93_00440 [Ruminococcus sp.]|nr:hypothetical protein [Ruminococcus sp.]